MISDLNLLYNSVIKTHVSRKEDREFEILEFILLNEPCTFGEIQKHLEKVSESYNIKNPDNRKGLARKLTALINENKIIKNDKAKPYPTYSVVIGSSLNVAIMGDLFRQNTTSNLMSSMIGIDDGYLKKDIPLNEYDSFEEKFVKTMVTRYGFFLLSVLVKGFEQTIIKNKFDMKNWTLHAINLMKDENILLDSFLTLLDFPLDSNMEYNLRNKKNKQQLKNKLSKLKISMKDIYPKLYQNIEYYEQGIESQPKKIRGLRKRKEILKNIDFDKLEK